MLKLSTRRVLSLFTEYPPLTENASDTDMAKFNKLGITGNVALLCERRPPNWDFRSDPRHFLSETFGTRNCAYS